MLDISTLDERRLAIALLTEDIDLRTVDELDADWVSGEVESVDTTRRDAKGWEIDVTYASVHADEESVFPCGEVVASSGMTPGDHDAYNTSMVVVMREVVAGHVVIIEGDHSGAGNSDETYEAYLSGRITVVPDAAAEPAIAAAVARHRDDVMDDVASQIDAVCRRLADATAEELSKGRVMESYFNLARQMARTA